jgi:hypothetical protein
MTTSFRFVTSSRNSFVIKFSWDPSLVSTVDSSSRPIRPQSRQSAKPFLQSSELGLPQPLTRRRVCPPPPPPSPRFWGEGHIRWRERGWESPNSDEGTFTVVLFIYTYFVATTSSWTTSGIDSGLAMNVLNQDIANFQFSFLLYSVYIIITSISE